MRNASSQFWKGKHVLLTGHTGFKGAWIGLWLSQLGAKVTGISLPPKTTPNLFTFANIEQITNSIFIDILDEDGVSKIVNKVEPEIVLHLAAQALVRPGYYDPLGTFAVNIMGTANILNALRGLDSVKAVVVVTTDKVYKNLEQIKPYSESDTLGGYDPYSSSKAASELVVSCYRDSYLAEQGVGVATARAGNVIGGGDWSEDRLIPDAVRAWNADLPLILRKPNAVRPWQHVLDPINGYLVLAERLYKDLSLSGSFNFGPKSNEGATVQTVVEMAKKAYGSGKFICTNEAKGLHEARLLSLEIRKAQKILGFFPRWNLFQSVSRTMNWYRQHNNNYMNARLLCEIDIDDYTNMNQI